MGGGGELKNRAAQKREKAKGGSPHFLWERPKDGRRGAPSI